MGRFEDVQRDVWDVGRKISEQLGWIDFLKQNDFPYARAVSDLQELEQLEDELLHHRDALRGALRRQG